MGNLFDIRIPAGEQLSLTTSCPVDQPFTPLTMTPHMHALGTAFHVEQQGRTLLSQEGWHPETVWFEPAEPLQVGSLEFTCEWSNTTDEEVNFGAGAADEMCFVFGWATGLSEMCWRANYSGCEAI